ncbi:hypothetical protein WICPIJ_009715 [Wickerhamomyces pijperi]|uniref:Uncharacterized protein n=1 Tax=Wickerhamomyces pijperi TaxID=599730 RepID=A0A9P8PK22_WICPI|nr:hypothetical protein WICPIJ_009715 [Wickerhamomyces pijperi]
MLASQIIKPTAHIEDPIAHIKAQKHLTQQWYINSLLEPQLDVIKETILSCIDVIREPRVISLEPEAREPKNELTTEPSSVSTASSIKDHSQNHNNGDDNKDKKKNNINMKVMREGLHIVELSGKVFFKSIGRWVQIRLKPDMKLGLDQMDSLIGYLTQAIGRLKDIECDCKEGSKKHGVKDLEAKFQQLRKVVDKCILSFHEAPRELLFPLNADLWSLDEICQTDLKRVSLDDIMSMELFFQNGVFCVSLVNFEKVKEAPWCGYNPTTNMSYVDELREKVKDNVMSINDIKQSDKKTLSHLLGFSKFTHMDYLQRAMTYKKQVVIEVEETVAAFQDSVLLLTAAKLRSVQAMLEKVCNNLQALQ